MIPMTPYRQGIEDYAAGRPFSPFYDSLSEAAQQSYERGRLKAAAAQMKRRPLEDRRFASGRMRDAPQQSLAQDDAPLAGAGQRGRR